MIKKIFMITRGKINRPLEQTRLNIISYCGILCRLRVSKLKITASFESLLAYIFILFSMKLYLPLCERLGRSDRTAYLSSLAHNFSR